MFVVHNTSTHDPDDTLGKLVLQYNVDDPSGFGRDVTSAVVKLREATFDKQVRYRYG